MTTRAWVLVAAGYVILATGLLIALAVTSRNVDRIDDQADALETAAIAYCQVAVVADEDEARVLRLLAIGRGDEIRLAPVCRLIARDLRE